MLFTRSDKIDIAAGRKTTTLRRWKRAQARLGGIYNIPPYGAIEVTYLSQMPLREVSGTRLKQAGYTSTEQAAERLKCQPEDTVYCIDFHYAGAAAVNQPNTELTDSATLNALSARLAKLDGSQAWTRQTLELIGRHPGQRAAALAVEVSQELPTFKRNVRKLKALGLTSSLETGYCLSPRGRQWLNWADTHLPPA